jgi:hypothetical protein
LTGGARKIGGCFEAAAANLIQANIEDLNHAHLLPEMI